MMLELLQVLPPKLQKLFARQVSLNELTVLSLNLSPGQALVLTNRCLYILRRKFLGTACEKFNREQLAGLELKQDSVVIKPAGQKDPLRLKITAANRSLTRQALMRINAWVQDGN